MCHEKFSTIILLDKFFVVKVITISINFVLVNIIVGAADPHHVLVNPPPSPPGVGGAVLHALP